MKRLLAIILAAAALATGCRKASVPAGGPRPRIVSFSPAMTEILFDMGLGEHVVGVTRFCKLPAGVERPTVGDVFGINADAILKLQPDVILTQVAVERFKGVRDVAPAVRVISFRLERLEDIPAAVDLVGEVVGRPGLADRTKADLAARIEAVRGQVAGLAQPRVLFVMGTDRPTAAGSDNFVADMIEAAGGVNAGADIPGKTRWVRTHIDAIVKAAPDVLICQTHTTGQEEKARKYWLQWEDLPAAKSGRVHAVGPEWSIPSLRLAELTRQLAEKIHSKTVVVAEPSMPLWRAWVYRMLAAAIVGAALAAGGMALQGLLRNPLAEPYILGVSSGAGVGVLLGMALAASWVIPDWVSTPVLAFAGALATCAAVYAIAQRRGTLDPYSLILSGVIVNTFNAAIMLTIYLYLDPHRIADFAYWAMGRLPDSVDVSLLWVCGGCVVIGWLVLLLNSAAFNVLGLGDEVASSSGVVVRRLRFITFLCVGLMTAAAVSLAGPIGFLGLIIPHICRMVFGADHRVGVIASGVVGAAFLMGAQTLCRVAGPWIGVSLIPVGILTALSGGPFFIYLLRRRFREEPA